MQEGQGCCITDENIEKRRSLLCGSKKGTPCQQLPKNPKLQELWEKASSSDMWSESKEQRPGTNTYQRDQPGNRASTRSSTNYNQCCPYENVVLQTARAFVRGRNESKVVEARILFDGGSQRSYVTQELQAKLGVKRNGTETLHVNTFGGKNYSKQKCDIVELCISKNGDETTIKALTFPTICSKLLSTTEVRSYPHLQGLDLADDFDDPTNSNIDLLVGSDYYWQYITGNVIKGISGPVTVESKLGWILSGVIDTGESSCSTKTSSTHLILHKADIGLPEPSNDDLVCTLEKFWQTESIGIRDRDEEAKPKCESVLDDVHYDGERYNVKLPWKPKADNLPDHYQLSVNPANYLLRHRKKNKELLAKYDCIIQEQLEAGVIEIVDPKQMSGRKTHYMPHHGVIRENKSTTKLRIVYDGSAHERDDHISINSCLRQGRNLTPSLFDILLRFRIHQVGLVADIEKAFLMIGISPADRDCLRFLWFQDVMTEENPKLIEYHFCRLVFGLKPSPAILGATILHHLSQQEQQDAVNTLKDSLYVDDLTTGVDTVTDAFELYQSSKSIMASGGFNLRKWTSNSAELGKLIEVNEHGTQITATTVDRDESQCITEDDQSYTKSLLPTQKI